MPIAVSRPSIIVKQLFDRESCTYTYLLIDPDSQEGAIIDPVKDLYERDMQLINEIGVELLYTVETHTHADHVTSSGKVRQSTGARIVFGEGNSIPAIDIVMKDGEVLELGNFEIKAIATPGHTGSCTSFYVDGMVFTGDALLIRGCGRTDFQEGDAARLYDSVTGRLFTLDDDTIVYPAHDYNGRTWSTIAEEKKWNPRLGGGRDKESFVELMNNLDLDMPKKINEAVPANTNVGVNFDPKAFLWHDFDMNDLHEVWQKAQDKTLIIDNRTSEEYAKGHVPGSINIPMGSENDRLEEFKNYDEIYIYCRSGRRAQTTFTNLSFEGLEHIYCISHSGMPDWVKAGYPVDEGS